MITSPWLIYLWYWHILFCLLFGKYNSFICKKCMLMKYGILYNSLNSAYILQSKSLMLSITKTWYPCTILLEIRMAPASTAVKEKRTANSFCHLKSDNTSVIKH